MGILNNVNVVRVINKAFRVSLVANYAKEILSLLISDEVVANYYCAAEIIKWLEFHFVVNEFNRRKIEVSRVANCTKETAGYHEFQ